MYALGSKKMLTMGIVQVLKNLLCEICREKNMKAKRIKLYKLNKMEYGQ